MICDICGGRGYSGWDMWPCTKCNSTGEIEDEDEVYDLAEEDFIDELREEEERKARYYP